MKGWMGPFMAHPRARFWREREREERIGFALMGRCMCFISCKLAEFHSDVGARSVAIWRIRCQDLEDLVPGFGFRCWIPVQWVNRCCGFWSFGGKRSFRVEEEVRGMDGEPKPEEQRQRDEEEARIF